MLARQLSLLVCLLYRGLSSLCMGLLGESKTYSLFPLPEVGASLFSQFYFIYTGDCIFIIEVINVVCSDSVPLFGYRRRSYLVLSGLFGALSWSLMATFVDNKYSAAFCILLGSFSVAFSDVVSVSYLVIHTCFFSGIV